MKKFSILILSCVCAFAACQKSEAPVDPGELRFSFSYPGTTKATASDFESGDKVSVFAVDYTADEPKPLQISGNWINNEGMTFNGTSWAASRKLTWPETKMDVFAVYPYQSTWESITEQPFNVATDQRTEKEGAVLGGYEASDHLWASVKGISKSSDTPSPVQMTFSHMCSRVKVKLVKGDGFSGTFPDDAKLIIHNTSPEGVFDASLGSVSKYLYGESDDIICRRIESSPADSPEYEAIVIPQRITSKRPFLEYLTDKISYLVQDTYNFKPGFSYTYTLTINSSPEQIVVSIGGSIDGWD